MVHLKTILQYQNQNIFLKINMNSFIISPTPQFVTERIQTDLSPPPFPHFQSVLLALNNEVFLFFNKLSRQ